MAKKLTVADIPHMLKMWDKKLNIDKPENVSVHCKDKKYWRCPDCDYDWSTSPQSRYAGSGKCPCHESNKVIRRGINDILTIVKGLNAFLDEDNDFDNICTQGIDSSLSVKLKCDECGRKWVATLRSQVKKDGNGGYIPTGCPHYNTVKRKKDEVPFCSEVDVIMKYWDTKNPLDPAKTRANSTEKVHLICKNCGYDWTAEIRNHLRGTGKCKCCDLHQVTRKGFTDVFTLIPESRNFFNFDKNKNIDIYSISLRNTEIPIDWKCQRCGREWRSPLAYRIKGKKGNYSFIGCKDCYLHSTERITPVSSIPKLIKYWDFKKNKNIDVNLTSAYSNTPANWRCDDCGYEWVANINSRMHADDTCPFCDGVHKPVIKGINDILTLCPEFAQIYDFDYNEKNGIDIYHEGFYSTTKARFNCKKCGNEWDSFIGNRVRKNADGTFKLVDCPACSHGLFRKTPYSVEFPILAKMYRNDLNNTPLDAIRGLKAITDTHYHWDCLICGETFESTLKSMIGSYEYSTKGCPYCSRTKLRKGESFAEVHPEYMKDYDPDNIINPYNVFVNSKEPVGWICNDCGYPWIASFALRHMGFGNCPICNRTALIPNKNSFAAVYPDYVKYWSDSNERRADEVFFNSSEWFRFICPTCTNEHGAYIDDFISDKSCPFCKGISVSAKTNSLKALYPDIAKRWSKNNPFGPETVFPTSYKWVKWICNTCNGEYNARVKDVVNGTDECSYCNGTKVLPGFNSFEHNHPDLMKEMDAIANYLLPKSPDEVSDSSYYKFWFICKNNPKHRYPMSPRTRLMFQKRNREPCLYCRGQRRKLHHFISYE